MRAAKAMIAGIALVAGCASTSAPTAGPKVSSAPTRFVDGIPIPQAGTESPAAVPVATSPTMCPPSLRQALETRNRTHSVSVQTTHRPDLLICKYLDSRPMAGGCTTVTLSINTQPQPFKDFQRWTVETGQNAMWSHQPRLNPRPVKGIGIEAEWAPLIQTFETATLNTWVAVFLKCHPTTQGELRLAKAFGRAGLHSTS